ncbi:hypothetical protein Tco_0915727 [Tanacetum coccineum]
MVAVNNLESTVTPLPFLETKKKKSKSQTVSQPTPKTQGLKASRALPQKKKKAPVQKVLLLRNLCNDHPFAKGFYSPLDEGTHKSKPLIEGKLTDAKDLGGNLQPTSMGLPFTPLNEGTSKSQPLLEGKTTDPKDSKGP